MAAAPAAACLLLALIAGVVQSRLLQDDGDTCAGSCGQAYVQNDNGGCHCDYWCNNIGDCCGGSAAKDLACPSSAPSLNKDAITDCSNALGKSGSTHGFKPGQCWCDSFCAAAGDCCPACAGCDSNNSSSSASSSSSSSSSRDSVQRVPHAVPAMIKPRSAAQAMAQLHSHSDCGVLRQKTRLNALRTKYVPDVASASINPEPMPAAAAAAAAVPASDDWDVAAEAAMQACQAADTGAPAEPFTFAVHWTAAQVCSSSGGCVGGDYTTETVHEQIAFMNKLFAHAGVAFTWDGVIHNATAGSYDEIDDDGWICALPRYGDGMTFHVITSPRHLFGGGVLGYTNYLSSFSQQYGGFPQCLNRVHIFEKTLPGLGGRSVVDGGLSDSGAVLAHEVGHQLMLHHTWFEATWERQEAGAQCRGSASMDPTDIAAFRSDGVRDTTAQSLNYTGQIIRFVGCHPATGLYTNSSINAQQSCTSAVGFPAGDAYYNNYNNLMSYGDKTCLRTITAGQAARARCAVKCMVLGQC